MIVGATQQDTPLALIEGYPLVEVVSILVFAAAILGLYAWTRREASKPVSA